MAGKRSAFLSLWLGLGSVIAQNCPNPNALNPPSCPPNCTPLTVDGGGNATIPNGQTRCIPQGVTLNANNLNIGNNSTLLICGQLNLNGWFNLNNNATVTVSSTGVVNAQGANINSNSDFYNYGTVHFSSSLSLNGNNSRFYNIGTGAVLRVGGWITVNSSNGFVNYGGVVQASNLTINGGGSVCMANGACFSVSQFTSNGNNQINVVGTNPVVVHFTGSSTINGGNVTSSSNLYVCQAPGATQNGSGSWGGGQVIPNCTGGCSPLAFVQLSVKSYATHTSAVVEWETEGAAHEIAFYVVELVEGENRTELARTTASQASIPYAILPLADRWTFRIAAYNSEGRFLGEGRTYLAAPAKASLVIYPTIFSHELSCRSDGVYTLQLMNTAGQIIGTLQTHPGEVVWHALEEGIPLASLPPGIYVLRSESLPYSIKLYKQP
ncbi:MAG: hypothetical protein RMK19_09010 [Bacteroidia bacterium]|nr:hypothetical protein [Bacteroidia bacterium]